VARWIRVGAGVAALLGGLAWLAKGTAILAVDNQPPLLFEVAPLCFGAALVGLGLTMPQRGRRRSAVVTLGAVSSLSGAVSVASELAGSVLDASLLVASLSLLVGLVLLGRRGHSRAHHLGWIAGVSMLPALLLGGVLSEWNERLLELPLVCLAALWIWLGLDAAASGARRVRRRHRLGIPTLRVSGRSSLLRHCGRSYRGSTGLPGSHPPRAGRSRERSLDRRSRIGLGSARAS